MKWWEWVFDGVGGVAGVSVLGFLLTKVLGGDRSGVSQKIEAGHGSLNVQAGRDVGGASDGDDE